MDTRPHSPFHKPERGKRTQKYQHFTLEPGDEALIAQLPPEQQAALRSQGSYASRAEQMGVAIGTVRSRLHRARSALVRLRQTQAPESDQTPEGENQPAPPSDPDHLH